MWIPKGLLLGLWMFSFGTLAYFWFILYRHLPSGAGSVDVRTLAFLTVSNPSWWLALVASLSIGLIVSRSWRIGPALWVTMAATELPRGVVCDVLHVGCQKQRNHREDV